jgi:GNAT superfamily N-acetyltransferase
VSDVTVVRLDQRPDLIDRLYDLDDGWPEFMGQDPICNALMNRVPREFPHTCVVGVDADGQVVARGRSMPFAFGSGYRTELPAGGLDRALQWAFRDLATGTAPTDACAIEIAVDQTYRGQGLSYRVLAAMSSAVRDAGLGSLYAPVRPSEKHLQPLVPMSEYISMKRPDGLPVDAWLRMHVRAGATIIGVAPASMMMAGSLAEWREWTGLPFDSSGAVIVPGALVPVTCDVEHDYAAYVEPNVWVRHPLPSPS